MSGNKPTPTCSDSPYATDRPGVLHAQPGRPHFPAPPPAIPAVPSDLPGASRLQPRASLNGPEPPKLPDVLDDGWFEQKLRKLMDLKLELARTRLESREPRRQGLDSLMPLESPAKVQQEKEEAYGGSECFVRPVEEYTKPFCDFLTENPTVFHAVDYFKRKLKANGFTEVCCCYFCLILRHP